MLPTNQNDNIALRKVFDFLIFCITATLAYFLRFKTFLLPFEYWVLALSFAFLYVQSLSVFSFYSRHPGRSVEQELLAIFASLILTLFCTSTLLYLTKTGASFSRLWLLGNAALSFVFLICRCISSELWPKPHGKSVNILVWGKTSHSISRLIDRHNNRKVKFYFLDEGPDLELVSRTIEDHRLDNRGNTTIHQVWVTPALLDKYSWEEIADTIGNSSASLLYIPALPESIFAGPNNVNYDNGLVLVNAESVHNNDLDWLFKRILDKFTSIFGLIALMPLGILISILIKFDSKGPVLYKQIRYGLNGEEFTMYKFRTMTHAPTNQIFKQATKNDPRVTRIGGFLRRTSLDELPQLLNVLKGDMSLVGPRPHANSHNEQYRYKLNRYMKRHIVKPGITGLAQVNGARGETPTLDSMKTRIDYDLEYVKNWNILLDLKIISKTIRMIAFDKRAY